MLKTVNDYKWPVGFKPARNTSQNYDVAIQQF